MPDYVTMYHLHLSYLGKLAVVLMQIICLICKGKANAVPGEDEMPDLDDVEYKSKVDFECDPGAYINRISSNKGNDDRKWGLGCKNAPGRYWLPQKSTSSKQQK